MNPKLQQILNGGEENLKMKVLSYFGYDTFVPIDDDYQGEVYEYNDRGVPGPWGKACDVVSEEEYQKLLAQYNEEHGRTKETNYDPYSNDTEHKLNTISLRFLSFLIILIIIGTIISLCSIDVVGGGLATGLALLIIALAVLLITSVYMLYLQIKVFTNISCRTTEIHKILKEKSSK